MQIEIISNSPVFTRNLAKSFSRVLSRGDIIIFAGELGGGKTTFISGLAEGLGVPDNLSSPSFTLLNEYKTSSRIKFIHADLYRLENITDFDGIGLEDYLYDGNSIICIEWGDRIKDLIKKEFLEIDLGYLIDNENNDESNNENDSKNEDTKRRIIFKSASGYWDLKLQVFKKILKKTNNS
ncbi:MAG: tRNA (adenosine(37)-N6)-threonylcarbamoyltransferase complex ATPase subunit type 1 TsaE [Candidatus Humimicrobiaceae bacterium]|jgi:tRNA threonylcarbamoyladenosine biosynthesis protein TsaE|nr:tRNA (adenosine(37)-N6)-threonylcarbamoyltransferase complex ATPase subunit type 1 TsaE [Candidatus Humimicrobiaceae bacterium]